MHYTQAVRVFEISRQRRAKRFVPYYDEPKSICSGGVWENVTKKEISMGLSSHVDELRKKHLQLSTMIEEEERSPGSDALAISELKRKKLRLKEEIARYSALRQ